MKRVLTRSAAVYVSLLAAFVCVAAAQSDGGVGIPPPPPESTKVDAHLCKTVGGGKFVRIPGFPGEKIDRRLLPDIRWMVEKYDIFITDGYSLDPVHAADGEHPIGLAIDIVPDKSGSWREVTKLALLAEPKQGRTVAPFRWVGYSGDANHGPHNHLHLSWMHSETKPGKPARVVYTRICPG